MAFDNKEFSLRSVDINQFWLKSEKSNGHFTRGPATFSSLGNSPISQQGQKQIYRTVTPCVYLLTTYCSVTAFRRFLVSWFPILFFLLTLIELCTNFTHIALQYLLTKFHRNPPTSFKVKLSRNGKDTRTQIFLRVIFMHVSQTKCDTSILVFRVITLYGLVWIHRRFGET
jgi:hypothetical protein